jgi:SH3-like domain-containing protein
VKRCIAVSVILAFAWLGPLAAAEEAPLPIPKPDSVHAALAPSAPSPAASMPDFIEPAPPMPETQTRDRPTPSGLPVPRWVSLKSGEVYLREGPSAEHRVLWVYVRRGLPVEVIAEYDVWRRIRDADGVVGWVHKGMLDGRRSVLISGGGNVPLRDEPAAEGAIVAYAEPGVVARLKSCGGGYCEVQAQTIDAYIDRGHVWGVYDGETVE